MKCVIQSYKKHIVKLVNFIVVLVVLCCASAAWCCRQHSQCDEHHKCSNKGNHCKRLTCSDAPIAGKKTPTCGKDFKCIKGECVPKTCEDADGPKCPADKNSCAKGICKAPCFGENSSLCANGFICTNPLSSMACAVGQSCLNSYCDALNCGNGGKSCADNEQCNKGKCTVIKCKGKKQRCPSGRKCVPSKGGHKHKHKHKHHHGSSGKHHKDEHNDNTSEDEDHKDERGHKNKHHKHKHHQSNGTCYLKTCADAGGPICPIDKLSCVRGACVVPCIGAGSKPCDGGLVCTNGNTRGACLPNQPCPNSSCQPLTCANGGKSCADNERCHKNKCEISKCKNNKCHSDRKCINGECYLKTCADAGGSVCKGTDVCRFDVSVKMGKCVTNTEKTCADPNGPRCVENQKCKINPDLSGVCVFKTCAESGGPACVGATVCRIDPKTKEGSCVDGIVKTCADGGGTVCPSNQKCQTNIDLSGACVAK